MLQFSEIKMQSKSITTKKVVKGRGQAPAWLTDVNLQHPIYRQVLEASLV